MPYSQSIHLEDQSDSSYERNNFGAFLKTTLVFVTAVGGYVFVRASGLFSGWNDETNVTDDFQNNLVTADEVFSFSQSNSLLPNARPLDISLPPIQDFELTEFAVQEQNNNKLTHRFNKRAVGDEFQVNTFTTANQDQATVARLSNGNFVASWKSGSGIITQDGNSYGVYAQIFSPDGTKVGSELRVNTYTTNIQDSPAIAALNDDNFVIGWRGYGQDYGIYAQIFLANGTKTGPEFQVNTYTTSSQISPAIATLNDGNFVIGWTSYGQDGGNDGIYAQIFLADGAKTGPEFQVNTYTTNFQASPAIAALNDGNFVIGWASSGQDGSSNSVFAQIFLTNGTKTGPEFQVNTYIINSQNSPAIAALNDGNFVIGWTSVGQDGSSNGVYAQIFLPNGTKVGSEFRVNTFTIANQQSSALTSFSDGTFVMVWESGEQGTPFQDGDMWGIYGQRFFNNGTRIDNEFQINLYTRGIQRFPTVTNLDNDRFVVLWQDETSHDGNSYGVFGRILDVGMTMQLTTDIPVSITTGIASLTTGISTIPMSTDELQINTYTSYTQGYPAITALNNDRFLVTWQAGVAGYNSAYLNGIDIIGQIIAADGNKQGSEFRVSSYSSSDQSYPAVAELSNELFIATWNGFGESGWGVYAQLFSTNTTRLGTVFLVNTNTVNYLHQPAVSPLYNDQFMIAWTTPSDGSDRGINAQRFSLNGTKLNEAFRVNSYTTSVQNFPAMAVLSDNSFVIAWEGSGPNGYSSYAKIFDATGMNITDDFHIPSAGTGQKPAVTALSNGNFVISYGLTTIYSQIYAPDGTAIGNRISSGSTNFNYNPCVAKLADGDFVVVWESGVDFLNGGYGLDGDGRGIFAQRFASNGTKVGSMFQVNQNTRGDQYNPDVASLPDGRFMIVWQDDSSLDGNSGGIYGRIFNIDSNFSTTQQTTQFQTTQAQTTNVGSTAQQQFTTLQSSLTTNSDITQLETTEQTALTTDQDVLATTQPFFESLPSSPSNASFIGILAGVLGGGVVGIAVCFGLFVYYKKRKKQEHSEDKLQALEENQNVPLSEIALLETATPRHSLDPTRVEKGHTVIGNKYALINKINQKEAEALYLQTGIQVTFKGGEKKTKFSFGQGHFGKLRVARNIETQKFVGVKKIKNSSNNSHAIQSSEAEASIQRQLQHSNLMLLLDSVKTKGSQEEDVLYQFMPLAGFGNGEKLMGVLSRVSDLTLKENFLIYIARSLLEGFAYLQSKQVGHLDFKPSNMVIDNKGHVYIIDFGCTQELGKTQGYVVTRDDGYIPYYSPERVAFHRKKLAVIEGQDITAAEVVDKFNAYKADMWTLGLALWELATGKPLYKALGFRNMLAIWDSKYCEAILGEHSELQDASTNSLFGLLKLLLMVNPEQRITAKQALALPLFKEKAYDTNQIEAMFKELQQWGEASNIQGREEKKSCASKQENPYYARSYYQNEVSSNKAVVYYSTENEGSMAKVYSQNPSFTQFPAPRQGNNTPLNSNHASSVRSTPGLNYHPSGQE